MAKSIYLINPKEDLPGYFSLEVCGQGGDDNATLFADLSTTTLAAMVPPDWKIGLCDERIMPVDLECQADVIGITGKISQRNRMIALADHFRGKSRLVAIGGSYASLNPEDMRPHCDILVRGEAEDIASDLFADIDQGRWRAEYAGGKVDLSRSPLPRWDLYPWGRVLNGTVQTSRGCPFECEFCDVIQYVGRKQRHKPVDRVLAELDLLYGLGCRGVFLADDNFTVFRKRTKELLTAIRDWNRTRRKGHVSLSTQVSIDAARDDELLTLCAQAGLRQVFIGIETPNEESLRETKTRQNLHMDLEKAVGKFLDHGIAVTCGIVIGFDSDGPGIFETQRDFIERLPIPILSIGALVAPSQTPLHARLRREGRLVESGAQERSGALGHEHHPQADGPERVDRWDPPALSRRLRARGLRAASDEIHICRPQSRRGSASSGAPGARRRRHQDGGRQVARDGPGRGEALCAARPHPSGATPRRPADGPVRYDALRPDPPHV